MKNFEGYIRRFARDNNVEIEWQILKFGYKRAVIHCDNWDEFNYLYNALTKRKQIYVDSWHCSDGGVFEGAVYIMFQEDYERLKSAQEAEQRKVENWWQRYHNADAETRRLMACGAID